MAPKKKTAKRAARKKASAKRPRAARKAPAQAGHIERRQPETLRLLSAAPSLTVNDLARSIHWYRDIVGFHLAEEWKAEGKVVGAELRAGAMVVMINQDDFSKGRDRKKGEAFRIYFSTRQDVDQLAREIKARGGVLAAEPADTPWGSREFTLVDPDGFKFTIARNR
jgi:uncharacterized glyoxalase superfamily protein PhnB